MDSCVLIILIILVICISIGITIAVACYEESNKGVNKMDGTVTISVDDFNMLIRCKAAVDKAYEELKKYDFEDEECKYVSADAVINTISILSDI